MSSHEKPRPQRFPDYLQIVLARIIENSDSKIFHENFIQARDLMGNLALANSKFMEKGKSSRTLIVNFN